MINLKIIIKDIEYNKLNNETNGLYVLKLENDFIKVVSIFDQNITIASCSDVEDLKYYGFDIKVLFEADKGILEAIGDEYGIIPYYKLGEWKYNEGKFPKSLNTLLRKNGYYL